MSVLLSISHVTFSPFRAEKGLTGPRISLKLGVRPTSNRGEGGHKISLVLHELDEYTLKDTISKVD